VLSICGNSFKTFGKAFQVTTSLSWLRECQEYAKAKGQQCAKGGYLEESQIYNIF
jgi:hypothetical protein